MSCPFCKSHNVRTISVFEKRRKKVIIEAKCYDCGVRFRAKFQRFVGLRWDLVKVKPIW